MNYLDEMKTVMAKWCTKKPDLADVGRVVDAMRDYVAAGLLDNVNGGSLVKCQLAVRKIIVVLLENDCKSDSTTIFLALNDIYKAVYNEMLFETLKLTHDLVRKDYGRLDEDKLVSEGINLFSRRK